MPEQAFGTILSVRYLPCPKCGAPNGQGCRAPNGQPARSPHIARRRAVAAHANARLTDVTMETP